MNTVCLKSSSCPSVSCIRVEVFPDAARSRGWLTERRHGAGALNTPKLVANKVVHSSRLQSHGTTV